MRTNKTEMAGNLMSEIIVKNKRNKKVEKMKISLTKEQLWTYFLSTFFDLYGKKLLITEEVKKNLKALFFYFLKDDKFFDCENLRGDISLPSFSKGLLIIGSFGLGKTDYFEAFEKVFYSHPYLRFKSYTSKSLVLKYETCTTPLDKECFFKEMERPLIYIDDISSERKASNYGLVDVLDEVIINRYDNKLRTYASCNYTTPDNCAKQTLTDLGLRYGGRMYDRFHEMFNIIEFKGKSFRR